jgi:hypothetical protein
VKVCRIVLKRQLKTTTHFKDELAQEFVMPLTRWILVANMSLVLKFRKSFDDLNGAVNAIVLKAEE